MQQYFAYFNYFLRQSSVYATLTALDLPTYLKVSQSQSYMCDWLLQMFPYQNHHCHHSHYAHQNFNTLSVKIIPENFPIIPGYSKNLPNYSGIFPDSFPYLLCSKLCRHNGLMPTNGQPYTHTCMHGHTHTTHMYAHTLFVVNQWHANTIAN